MNPERLAELDGLLNDALEQPPADRARWLAEACRGRDDVRADVEALLAAHEGSDAYFSEFGAGVETGSLATGPSFPIILDRSANSVRPSHRGCHGRMVSERLVCG